MWTESFAAPFSIPSINETARAFCAGEFHAHRRLMATRNQPAAAAAKVPSRHNGTCCSRTHSRQDTPQIHRSNSRCWLDWDFCPLSTTLSWGKLRRLSSTCSDFRSFVFLSSRREQDTFHAVVLYNAVSHWTLASRRHVAPVLSGTNLTEIRPFASIERFNAASRSAPSILVWRVACLSGTSPP